jgi:glutamate 5-kinase
LRCVSAEQQARVKNRQRIALKNREARMNPGKTGRGGIVMKLDAGLEAMEDGFVTEAEQADQETEIKDMQSLLDDDVMEPNSLETDMENAYYGFHDNESFEGVPVDGYTDSQLEEIARDATGLDMPEDGFHIEA